jgi:DNA-directed RNA polymerase specialized sigma24 family protein
MAMSQVLPAMKSRLSDPELRREVEAAVRRRVRGDEAEDVVQATFADVLAAPNAPAEPDEFRRFVFGVARNKVFDHFRRRKHLATGETELEPAAPEPPLSARDILRWAEGALPDSEAQTLEWLLREGDGEKLEHIARDARLPATRVRKRVSRLRKFFRERWTAELALAGLLLALCTLGVVYLLGRGKQPKDVVEREPSRPAPSATPAPRPAPEAPRALPPSAPAGSVPPAPSAAPSAELSTPPARKVLPAKPSPKPTSEPAPTFEKGSSVPSQVTSGNAQGGLDLDSSPAPSKSKVPPTRGSKPLNQSSDLLLDQKK